MPTGKHTSNTKAPAARPRPAGASRSARPAGASRSARPPQASRSPRPPQGAHRGLAILAVVCVLALTAGFLLQSFLPAPVSAAVDERLSTSMVRISEVMTSNASAFQADNGQYTDWVELVNTGATDVSLKGYTLLNADDALAPLIFPDVTLAPGEYLLIYCDGTLKNAAGYALHAPFRLSASGVTLGLYDAEGARVDAVDVPGLERNFVYRRDQQTGAWGASGDYTPGMANTLENHLSFDVGSVESPLVISEVSSANRSYARCADGQCCDYIELHNTSAQTVDLSGLTLTDDPNDLEKFVFPEGTVIGGNGYLLIYASGRAAGEGSELHAPFKLSSDGESVLLCDREGRALSGVELPALLSDQAYSLDENGEYTAGLAPTPGLPNDEQSAASLRAQVTQGNASGVYINEFMASETQRPHDWLELYNSSSQAVDISGWGLSDDASSPRKWRFPAGTVIQPGSYLTLFLSGTSGVDSEGILNASFRLGADGGYSLILSDASGAPLDRVFVPEQYAGVSYARMGNGDFLYATEATPNQPNASGGYAGRADAPEISVPGGLYHTGDVLTVEISAAPGARVYYTLDSSMPDESDALYTGPIAVSATTVVRARAYESDCLPSYVDTQTYLYDADHEMRVVSLVADPYEMFDETDGLYSLGPNASPTYPHTGANYWRTDELEGHVEMFDENGSTMISQGCGVRLHGQYSRAEAQKAFKIIARREYSGLNRFHARIFSRRDYEEYQSFLLRGSGQDGDRTRMRDSVLQTLAENTSVMYMETELCVVYINGQYWGHYNIRERINKFSICQFEGWEGQEDDIDLVKANDRVMQGSNQTYADMLAYVKENGIPNDEVLARVGEVIDLQNYIEYHALEIFVGNGDTLNVKRYRNKNADGKWRYCLFDLDWAFDVDTNSIGRWLAPGGMGTNKYTDNALFIALMKNATFRDRFLTYMGEMMATEWTTEKVIEKFHTRYDELMTEMPRHGERWGMSRSGFESQIEELVDYARTRPARLLEFFQESMNLTDDQMRHYFGDAGAVIRAYQNR